MREFAAPWSKVVLVALVAAPVVPTAIALGICAVASTFPADLSRTAVTAIVYAPVTVVAALERRYGIATISTGLTIGNGLVSVALAVDAAVPGVQTFATAIRASVIFEVAALALLPWLLMRIPGSPVARAIKVGIVVGSGAVMGQSLVVVASFWSDVPAAVSLGVLGWAVASFVCGVGALVWHWHRHPLADGPPRSVAAWFAVGAALLVVSYGRVPFGATGGFGATSRVLDVLDVVFLLAQLFLVLGLLAGLRRHPLPAWITRAVVAAICLIVAVSAYLLTGTTLAAAGSSPATSGAVAAGVLALVLGAVGRPVRAAVDVILGQDGPGAREVLARLTGRGPEGSDVTALAESLRSTWDLDSVEIALAAAPAPVRVGRPSGDRLTLPLVSRDDVVGQLTLSGGADGRWRRTVEPVLSDISRLIAVAAMLASVNEELAATRRRTLDVRTEERRLVHRHLQDSLGPTLAGLGFALTAATRHLDTVHGPVAIAELRDEVAVSTREVRRLARLLLPTALDQGDLEGALRDLAQALAHEEIGVTVHAVGVDRVGAADQLGVYLLVAESLMLTSSSHGPVDVEVRNDGSGVGVRVAWTDPAGAVPVGVVRAATARVRELGGTCGATARGFSAVLAR